MPLPRSLSIQVIRLPASGAPISLVGSEGDRSASLTLRSISRIADFGSDSSAATDACAWPICASSSRICGAPPPDAAW